MRSSVRPTAILGVTTPSRTTRTIAARTVHASGSGALQIRGPLWESIEQGSYYVGVDVSAPCVWKLPTGARSVCGMWRKIMVDVAHEALPELRGSM